MPIKTFRGLMADGVQDIVPLHSSNGSVGFRIKQLQIITNTPYQTNEAEHIVKIYTVPQSTIDGTVNMSDTTLLAVAITNNAKAGYETFIGQQIIFEHDIFNQDIYITHFESHSSEACNYYLELEQIKLDLNENTVATLKDIRNLT